MADDDRRMRFRCCLAGGLTRLFVNQCFLFANKLERRRWHRCLRRKLVALCVGLRSERLTLKGGKSLQIISYLLAGYRPHYAQGIA